MVHATEQSRRLETIGSRAAGIAHDINNQLTLILNYLDIADVTAARRAAGRCADLTSSLLSYCRGESLVLRPLGVAAFLRSFRGALQLPPGVSCTLELERPLPDIEADPNALTRALNNLISNACEAMNNEGAISIRASDRVIEVRDSGPGIRRSQLGRIFEPFYTTKGSAGTGLGLAIVGEIMLSHGGSVTVCSEPGQGAAFALRFR